MTKQTQTNKKTTKTPKRFITDSHPMRVAWAVAALSSVTLVLLALLAMRS